MLKAHGFEVRFQGSPDEASQDSWACADHRRRDSSCPFCLSSLRMSNGPPSQRPKDGRNEETESPSP